MNSLRALMQSSFRKLDEESNRRRESGEIDKYNRPRVLVVIGLALGFVVYGLVQSLTPPQSIVPTLKNNPQDYFLVRDGEVFFGKDPARHPITLPFRKLDQLPGYDPNAIWYEFKFAIPRDRFRDGETALLIPKVWGRSVVYLDGRKIDFGKDVWPLVPLQHQAGLLQISVKADQFLVGLRATYPLIVGDIEKLRELRRTVDDQLVSTLKVQSSQLVIAALFILLFLMMPSKPELLTFVLYFVVSAGFSEIHIGNYQNSNRFDLSRITLLSIQLGLDLLRSIILFRFVLEFFRIDRKRLNYLFRESIAYGAIIIPGIWFLLSTISPGLDKFVTFNILHQAYFLAWAASISIWMCAYLALHVRHYGRAFVGSIIAIGIVYTFSANVRDYWFVFDKVTGEMRNHLFMYFLMASVISLEYARTERDKRELAKNLPREQRLKFLRRTEKHVSGHRGFVLLVDGVGFSENQNAMSLEEQGKFTDGINRHLMNVFGTLAGTSILNGTGDGYYFAWEGPLTESRLSEIESRVEALFSSQPDLGDLGVGKLAGSKVRFRCALGFGDYSVGQSSARGLQRDFATGTLLTELARIIGGGTNEQTFRLLASTELKELGRFAGQSESYVDGKWNRRFAYIEPRKYPDSSDRTASVA